MTATTFGQTADGTPVPMATLTGGGLTVEVIGLGAAIRSLNVDIGRGASPRVLGLETLEDYLTHSPNMGVIAGRYANRIGGAHFVLDGQEVNLVPNEGGTTQLHGGPLGFSKRIWSLVDHGPDHALLSLTSEAGDQGFPGRVEAFCHYSIPSDGVLRLELTATTDAPTVVNLAAHSYFNLDGTDTILDHLLEIPADFYTPVDDKRIPTGEIRSVEGSPFDFRTLRPIGLMHEGSRAAYDHNYIISRTRAATPQLMARAIGPDSRTELQVFSTEPGVQLYAGSYLGVPVKPLHRTRTAANAGFCLEPQLFPDTPNKPQFGDATLRPGETYRQITDYRFRAA